MRTTAVIIGAGHAGLAMSWHLARRSIDHVVLERGEIANSWKTERWDSLRLLTPNWLSRLPGYDYADGHPDGFRTMPETIAFIERYADAISAPVRSHTSVTSVRRTEDGYKVSTNRGEWRCEAVIVASGACNTPLVPMLADQVPAAITALTPFQYRNADQLESGGVLIVGASATGIQIADEIHRSGRPVIIAVGEHVRAPRTYRGKDIQWWMDAAGLLDERYDEIDDVVRARNVPSMQLVGSAERRTLDLNSLTGMGVQLVGRLAGINDGKLQFSGSLRNHCELADLKMNRLLDRIDEWATQNGLDGKAESPHRFPPTEVEASPRLGIDLNRGSIRTIIWATGFRPDHSWLDVPVFDRKGRIRHDGGIVDAPGMYLMGMPFLRRRKSSLIDGADADARDLSEHLASWLGKRTAHSSAFVPRFAASQS